MAEPVLILLGVLGLTGAVLYLLDRVNADKHDAHAGEPGQPDAVSATACDDDDCALHTTCPTAQLVADELITACKPPYFDDEELDVYAGRGENDYNDAEIEQWRDVLYTLLPADRAPWQHSIRRRGIAMPAVIRDELMMLLAEQ